MKASFSTRGLSTTLAFSLLFTFFQPQIAITKANALTVGSGVCLQNVDTTTAVSVTASGSNCILTFNFSGTTTLWSVPALGLSNVSFTIKGSKGGGTVPDAGYGAQFSGVIPNLTGSSQLYISIGGPGVMNGAGGFGGSAGGNAGNNNGGYGGGGATDVRLGSNTSSARVLVAGGGGGGTSVSAVLNNGADATGSTGGAGKSTASCSGSNGANASAGGGGGNSINCRNAGAGGGGYAGGGGGGNSSGGVNSNGGHGGNGSSFWDGSFASINSDCGTGCTFWNNGTSNTNSDYSKYTNNASGSLVLTFAPNVSSVVSEITASANPVFRKQVTLTVTVNIAAYVTFQANNKKIPGCIKRLASGSGSTYSASCTWTPAARGSALLIATAAPVDNQYLSSATPAKTFLIGNRTGLR